MKKTFFYALAAAVALTSLAEVTPALAGERAAPDRYALERVRADAMNRLAAGDLQEVRHRPGHRTGRKRYRSANRFSPRYIHRRGRWCSKGGWYGRRCAYTPRPLRYIRQR